MNQIKPKKCKVCGDEFFPRRSTLERYCKMICQIADQKKQDYIDGGNRIKSKGRATMKIYAPTAGKSNKGYSESQVFQEIWEALEPKDRVSFVTGKRLFDPVNARAWYFSHVLPKGKAKYPMFKYYKKNIVLKEFDEHQTWEYKQYLIFHDKQWKHVFNLKKELIQEYKEHLKLFEQGLVDYYKT